MLPNWLYTQNLLPVELAALAADPRADTAEVLARLSACPLADVGRRDWEQIGRGLAALGAASPDIGREFAVRLAERYRGDAPRPYLIRAALLVAVAVGVASAVVRGDAQSQTPQVGEGATTVLTAQAALLRVLSMLDVLAMTGRGVDATVSASFHAVVRGAGQMLRALDDPAGVIGAVLADEVLDDPAWSGRVARSLVGDWSSFEGCE